MQLESEREKASEMRRSINAKWDALLEERELMLAMHRDKMRTSRARLEAATKTRVGRGIV